MVPYGFGVKRCSAIHRSCCVSKCGSDRVVPFIRKEKCNNNPNTRTEIQQRIVRACNYTGSNNVLYGIYYVYVLMIPATCKVVQLKLLWLNCCATVVFHRAFIIKRFRRWRVVVVKRFLMKKIKIKI